MPEVINLTPFAADRFVLLDQHGSQNILVVVSAAFEDIPGRMTQVAERQSPIRSSDEFYGAPGKSSVRYEADIAWEKPRVDILVNGHAMASKGRKVERSMVTVELGSVHKSLLASGDRMWKRGLLGLTPSSPAPFETMPIVYERAFGGISADGQRAELRNLVGLGLQQVVAQAPDITTEVPNIEYPDMLITSPRDCPAPAGLGVIGRGWSPRLELAGTYDARWMADQAPLLPLDFNPGHFQAAPSDQQSHDLDRGVRGRILGMTPEGEWQFSVPSLDVPVRLRYSDRSRELALRVDTILLEPDHRRLTLTARARIPVIRNRAPLREIILGHFKPGWWRARERNKVYLGAGSKDARLPGAEDFHL